MNIFERLRQINSLKSQLEALDYKAQKNIEYEKMGLPLPYLWQDIHEKKEILRQQINELQEG